MKYLSYIAKSKDGYVATKNHDVSFLDSYFDVNLKDYAYDKFMNKIDTVIMGLNTYKFIERHGEDPYPFKMVYVLAPSGTNVEYNYKVVQGTPIELETIFENDGATSIWVMGGPNVHQQYIDSGLLKQAIVFTTPDVLKDGIKLFNNIDYKPSKVIPFDKGTSIEIYDF